MNKNLFALVLVSLTLTGCTAGIQNGLAQAYGVKNYQDTNAPQKARLRVIKGDLQSYEIYPSGCLTTQDTERGSLNTPVVSSGSLKDQLNGKARIHQEKLLGMPFPPKVDNGYFYEFNVPANKKMVLNFLSRKIDGTQVLNCSQYRAVTFEPGKDYELRDVPTGMYSCSFSITEIQTDGSRIDHKQQKLIDRKEATCKNS
ncbi:hypothetical protein [Alkanindiges illinoisensis]|uniref:hypothetical protein n=1 Tax=Alkanindiges illinoisensis TaxID=197183 RepID=UPI00047E9E70|nr:hypothetical protein [Alkanindiges illinoisensis]